MNDAEWARQLRAWAKNPDVGGGQLLFPPVLCELAGRMEQHERERAELAAFKRAVIESSAVSMELGADELADLKLWWERNSLLGRLAMVEKIERADARCEEVEDRYEDAADRALVAERQRDALLQKLVEIHSWLGPRDVRLPGGVIMRFDNPEAERAAFRGLCEAIRAVSAIFDEGAV